jgi:hypothetical protein
VLGPPAGDEAAHLYRTLLVREGVWIWDNLWYGGHYPLASYSLLYYLPAAVIGNEPLAVIATVFSAALFASICIREWGAEARWPARSFAVLAAVPVFTGTYPWAAGLACALGSLRAFQGGRVWLALACAALTLGFSPLGFGFLCLVLLAVAAVRSPPRKLVIAVGGGLAVLAGIQLAIDVLFPALGRYEFPASELGIVLAVVGAGAAVAWRAPGGRLLVALFLLLGAVCIVAFLAPSPLGSNLTRFRTLVFPAVLLAAVLARFRPRLLAVPLVVAALAYNIAPHANIAGELTDSRAAGAAFWAPALDFLRQRSSPDYRVDVVPTFDNWEAYFVPRAGFALARGWYRQLDLDRNRVLYEEELTADEYREWLRSLGVRYVLLPHVELDRLAAEDQAVLLRSGDSGLSEVLRTPGWTIYELPQATPVLSGPGASGLSVFEHDRIEGWARAPGSYRLRVRYTPYWEVAQGDVCLEEATDGMTVVRVRRPGAFVLGVPGAGTLLRVVFGVRPSSC